MTTFTAHLNPSLISDIFHSKGLIVDAPRVNDMVSAQQGIKAAKELQEIARSFEERTKEYLLVLEKREERLRAPKRRLSIAERGRLAREALGYGSNE